MPVLRLVDYNIKSGQHHPDGLNALAATLRELEPDVLALQEIDRGTDRSGRVDQAAVLADLLGLPHVRFGPATDWVGGGEYGVALLSRHPLEHVVLTPLWVPIDPQVHQSLREPRTLLSATIRPEGHPVRVLATHLGLGEGQRRVQIREIAAAVDQVCPHAHPVVMGDLNCAPNASALTPLKERLRDAHRDLDHEHRCTYPTGAPPTAPESLISDYVFVPDAWEVEHSRVYRSESAPYASDHYAVAATVTFDSDVK